MSLTDGSLKFNVKLFMAHEAFYIEMLDRGAIKTFK